MSYFNFSFAAEKGLKPTDIINLQILSQARTEDISNYLNTAVLTDFEEKGYVVYVKGKKSSRREELARLSESGKSLLELITTPCITEGDEKMFEYLKTMYLSVDEERKVGNAKKTLQYCAEFRQLCGITLHEMFYLSELFTAEFPYSKVLEFIFFQKRDNPYGKFRDNLDSSKLYQFYQDNKERVQKYWAQKIKQDE